MTNTISKYLLAAVLLIFGFSACEQSVNSNEPINTKKFEKKARDLLDKRGEPISGQYIIVLEDKKGGKHIAFQQTMASLTLAYNIKGKSIERKYHYTISGFTAELSDQQLTKLKNDKRIDYIVKDRILMLKPPTFKTMGTPWWCYYFPNAAACQVNSGGGSGQVVPYGITRVDGPVDASGFTSKAWIIDTGIDLDHPDLNVNVQLSAEFVSGSNSPNDQNGHGTHVAGTIAAIDNNIDVVGVAAGATVVAVRVLGANGSGALSNVIAGIDYVAANASTGDVANLSLGASGTYQVLNDAIRSLASQGVYVAIAAGNAGRYAANYSPAQVNAPNVWTVSAVNENDVFASFSNYGNPPVDVAAPGVQVKSLWLNGGINTISGTSMASPHAAGVLLVTNGNPSTDGYAVNDPDGNPDPIIHL